MVDAYFVGIAILTIGTSIVALESEIALHPKAFGRTPLARILQDYTYVLVKPILIKTRLEQRLVTQSQACT